MKILSWNCNRKFRTKYPEVTKYDADIYVIQECEDPKASDEAGYIEFAQNHLWVGNNKNQGLGIFAKNEIVLKQNDWNPSGLRYFLSVNVNEVYDLVGVWACKPYIKEYFLYQSENIHNFNEETIIIGDFNGNRIWDKKHRQENHSTVVGQLLSKGLHSAYHHTFQEQQGEESIHTLYHHKHLDKGYHIDHCFINENLIVDYQVLSGKNWLQFSDHIPLLLTVAI